MKKTPAKKTPAKKALSLAERISKLERLMPRMEFGYVEIESIYNESQKVTKSLRERVAALEQTEVKTLAGRVRQLERESQMLRGIVREAELRLTAHEQTQRPAHGRHVQPDELAQRVTNAESALQYTISLQSRVNILMERVAALEAKPCP